MRRILATAAALSLVAGLGMAAPGAAQERTQEAMERAASGTVTVVDVLGRTFSIRDADDQETTFAVDDDTTILEGGRHVALDRLQAGDRVAVDLDDRGGVQTATYVEVVEDPGS